MLWADNLLFARNKFEQGRCTGAPVSLLVVRGALRLVCQVPRWWHPSICSPPAHPALFVRMCAPLYGSHHSTPHHPGPVFGPKTDAKVKHITNLKMFVKTRGVPPHPSLHGVGSMGGALTISPRCAATCTPTPACRVAFVRRPSF